MANKGTIDEIVDPKAFAQLEKLNGAFIDVRGQLIGLIKDAKGFSDAIGDSKSIKEFENNIKKSNAAIDQMAVAAERTKKTAVDAETQKQKAIEATLKKFEKESKAIIEVEQAEINRAKTEKAVQELQKKGITQSAEVVKGLVEQKLKLSELSAQEKQLNKDFAAGIINNQQYTTSMTALNLEAGKIKATMQAEASAVNQLTKAENAQGGSVNQLSAQLNTLRASYNSLTKAERENSQIGGVIIKDIQKLDKELKAVDATQGVFTRNVGNYSSALSGLPGPIGGAVSSIQNFSAALFANPIAIVVGALYGLYEAFKLNDDASNRIAGTFRGLKNVVGNLSNEIVDLFSGLNEGLSTSNDEVEKSGGIFSSVFGSIKDTVGGVLGQFVDTNKTVARTILDIIPGGEKIKSIYKDAKESILGVKDAVIETVDAGVAYEVMLDDIEQRQKTFDVVVSDLNLNIQRQATIVADATKEFKVRLTALDEESALQAKITGGKLALIDSEIKANKKLAQTLAAGGTQREEIDFKILELQAKRNAALQEQEALETTNAKKRAKFIKGEEAERAAANKKIIDDEYNLQRQRIEIQRDGFKAVADNSALSLEVRLAAEQSYYDRQASLLSLSLAHDLKEVDLSNTKRIQLNEKFKADTEKNEAERVKNINKIALDSYRQAEDEFSKSLSRKEKLRLEGLRNDLFDIEAARDRELAAVVGNSQAAKDERIAIERRYTLLYIDEQIKQAEAAIKASEAAGLKVNEQEAQLQALRRKRNEAGLADDAKTLKTKEQQQQEFLQATSQISQGVFDLLGSLSNALYQSQLNDINNISKQNDKRYSKEKDLIESSTLSESDKKAKLAILDKKKAAQDEQLAEKKKQADLAAARRDRAIKVAQIIANTAIAVLAQLSIPGAGFGLAAAAAAVGALQLATLLATPLPSYEHGGLVPESGPARVSEKGRELVFEPDGTVWQTPDQESIVHLNKGARVLPHPATERYMANQTLSSQVLANSGMDVNKINANADRNADKVVKAMGRKAPIVTERNGIKIYKTAS